MHEPLGSNEHDELCRCPGCSGDVSPMDQYEVEPEDYWQEIRDWGGDGYDVMEQVELDDWTPLASWKGRLIGDWPYVIVFERGLEVALWQEGTVTAYRPPTKGDRTAILDEIAEVYGEKVPEDMDESDLAAAMAGEHESVRL